MNKKKLIVLFVFAFLLSGCKDKVKELYDGNAYASENFIDNYYEIWNEDLINNVSSTINYELTVDNPETPNSEGIVKIDYKQRVAMGINPSLNYIDAIDQINPDTKEYLNWFDDTPIEDKGKGFGPTKNLSTIDKSFAYGYLSKLYDGRIQCDGYYAKSRVQLSNIGYGASFPKQLESAKYIGLSLRGGTTCERQFSTIPTVNFNLSFYSYDFNNKSYTKYSYIINDCPVITNSGGRTELISFYFKDTPLGNIPQNVTAMSIEYELSSSMYDDLITDPRQYDENDSKQLFSIMLYEVLIPDSTWQ